MIRAGDVDKAFSLPFNSFKFRSEPGRRQSL
jgi:hypothetical protein